MSVRPIEDTVGRRLFRAHVNLEVTGSPQHLFAARVDPTNGLNWDVLPDGRFVVVRSGPKVGREVRVMFDWLPREQ